MMMQLHVIAYFASLDHATLLLLQSTLTLLSTLLLTTIAFYSDSLKAQRLWALGNIVCCAGLGIGSATSLPPVFQSVVSYGLLGLGLAIVVRGLRMYCGLELARSSMVAICVGAMVMPCYFTFVKPDQLSRFIATGYYFAALVWTCAYTLLRHAKRNDSIVSIVGFSALGLCMFTRGTYLLLNPVRDADNFNGVLNAGLFMITLSQVCIAFGMTIMVLRQHARRLKQLVTIDTLTGALNRAGLDLAGQRIVQRAERDSRCVAVLLVDADHFKKINDTYGHAAGDVVLRHLSGLLAAQTRPNDMLVRLGGEEFVLVLDGMNLDAAMGVAERLLRVVSEATVVSHNAEIRYTVSIGAAGSEAYGYNLMQLISKSDAAMYAAKRAGRNRVAML
jgi:diguanylate cyclase (GGDEF)-like protein